MSASHKYLPLFVAEANEQLEALGSDLVRLEKEAPGPALWDSIFRRVHSVKGSAATLGFWLGGAAIHSSKSRLM